MSRQVRDPSRLTDQELEMLLYDDGDDPELTTLLATAESDEDSDGEPEEMHVVDDEQEAHDGSDDSMTTFSENIPFYVSKDNTKWAKVPFRKGKRTLANILRIVPGLTNYSAGFENEEQVFALFMSEDIINIIVTETNRKATQVIETWNAAHPDKNKRWKPTDSVEIKAFLGLLLIMGGLHSNKESLKSLWTSQKAYARPVYPASMSRQRFQMLSAFLRFDNYETRIARKELDKLAPIREIFDLFVENCKKSYNPGTHLTIDEQLVSFRGRCSFRVYMKGKPDRYGIKIWALADSANAYSLNLQVYLGKSGTKGERNQGERVVLDLVQFLGPGYGITTDNFFTSLSLADKLLEKNLTICGTLRQNKTFIPQELLPHISKPLFSSMFAYTKKHTLVSYVPTKKKAVILLSTEHHDDSIAEENSNHKPDIVMHYNKTKSGVDTTDKMVKQYSARRISNRWPMVIFGQILDIAALNAYRLYEIKYPEKITKNLDDRKIFILKLGELLVKQNIIRRYRERKENHLKATVVQYMKLVVPELEDQETEFRTEIDEEKSVGRCYLCSRERDRKSRNRCSDCKKFICKGHSVIAKVVTCENCNSKN